MSDTELRGGVREVKSQLHPCYSREYKLVRETGSRLCVHGQTSRVHGLYGRKLLVALPIVRVRLAPGFGPPSGLG